MRVPLAVTIIFLCLFASAQVTPAFNQTNGNAVIEGAVYDIYEAVIVGAPIWIENTETSELVKILTGNDGRYSVTVREGRYNVALRPFPGYPLGYQHSSFLLSSSEHVAINFRPRPPYAISDSIEGGHWSEKYEGPMLMQSHFITQPNGAIRDLRIQCRSLRTRGKAFEYRYWLIASFDRFTVYSDYAVFDENKAVLVAKGHVIFEDGKSIRKATQVEIDLRTGSVRTR